MVDPTTEFKKVMKYIQNSIGAVEPGAPSEQQPQKSTQAGHGTSQPQKVAARKPQGQSTVAEANDGVSRCQVCNK